jgi:hypothetical protein
VGAHAAPAATATPGPSPGAARGTVFIDANRNGIQDLTIAGRGGITVVDDANGTGHLEAGEASVVTDQRGDYRLPDLTAGPHRLCVVVPPGWAPTTPRCQVVSVAVGEAVDGIDFGLIAQLAKCCGGLVTATITGIDLADEPELFFAPTALRGPARGPYAGTRLWVRGLGFHSLTYLQRGEQARTTLTVGGVDAGRSPNLVLRYRTGGQPVVRVEAATGQVATWLGQGSPP